MPFVISRGQRIHYTLDGDGPLVVLQHGMLSNARSWIDRGVVGGLSDAFQVACVDSLGHGQSDKPAEPDLYEQSRRAADIVAVIDHLGAEKAHFAGYSMGGWIGVGMAKYFPQRLASLAIGGWDLIDGVKTANPPSATAPMTFEDLLRRVRRGAPALVEWVTPEVEPGLRACWEGVHDLAGAREAVLGVGCPVMLWDGREDPYHDPMQSFAAAHDLGFLSIGGDHLTALFLHASEVTTALRAFFGAAR